MLQRIRDNASGPLAYAVVALITLVFGVWGIGSYFTDSPNPVVASVGSAEITKYELDREYDRRYQRLQRLMGENFDHELIKPDSFKREVLQGLIEREMLAQYARDEGFRTTDSMLLQNLADDRRFQVDGKFSPDRYSAMLSQARISPAQYEAGVRSDLQLEQIRAAVLQSAFVAPTEAQLNYRLENQKRKVAYLHFDPAAYVDGIQLDPAEVETYFSQHRGQYLQPERVKLAYVELDLNALEDAESPGDEYLKTLYEQEKSARFATPERRQARHILVQIDEDTNADAARDRILALRKQLEEGADFATLAKAESDDQGTAEKGGSLDWVTRGTMVKPFEDRLFEMEVDSISQPVKTDFGWHIIRLDAVESSEIKPFSDPEVQAELLDLYQTQERQERYRQLAEKLDSLSLEAATGLDFISEELGLEVRETKWVNRDGSKADGIGRYDGVRKAAFSPSVLQDKLNSTPVQLGADRQVVVRVTEHETAQQQPLDEVRESVRANLRAELAASKASEAAAAAIEALRGGESLQAIADAQSDAELKAAQWVKRDSEDAPPAVLSTAFSLQLGEGGNAFGEADLGARGKAAVQVLEIEDAEADEVLASNETLMSSLRSRRAGTEYAAFMSYLRERTDVEIRDDLIN